MISIDKIKYKFFDLSFKESTHIYNIHKFNNLKQEINKNFISVKKYLGGNKLITLNQVHGNEIIEIDENTYEHLLLNGDAMFTTQKNIILGIQTADCVPILLSTRSAQCIGAVHCGWKSAKLNIIKNIIQKMKEKTNEDIFAIIGPSIQQKSYEVNSEFYQNFLKDSKLYKTFFIISSKPNHFFFDLQGFIIYKLREADVSILDHVKENTYVNKIYPSYRRSFHDNKECNERILSCIMIS